MIGRLARTAAIIGATIFSMAIGSSAALAEKRVALVIGNSKYQSVQQLPNPSRDANAVAQLLRDAHFDSVDVQLNLGIVDFKRAVRKFEDQVEQADIAVIYYAGHGFEINGTNYLIPVDAMLVSDRDAEDEALPLDLILSRSGSAKKFRVIILDACRDNPFSSRMQRKKSVSRGVSGLGKIDLSSTTDTLTAYAAKLGSTAEDGDGEHSPFTTALLKNLTVPGLDIRMAFGRIKTEVMTATAGHQEPYVYGSLGGDTYALVPAPAGPKDVSVSEAKADYDLIAKINNRRAWEVFLGRYQTGPYSDLARKQLASLSDDVPQSAVNPPGNPSLASVGPNVIAPGREPSSKEALDWDRVKNSTDQSALEKFIRLYRDSPLAITAQQRLDILKQAERDRKAAEDERRAKAAEAEQRAKAADAERKATEAKQKADEAERTKSAAEAAALRAASEKQTGEAVAERKKSELASAQEAACKMEQVKFDEFKTKGNTGSGLDNLKAFSKSVTCDRLRPQVVASIDKLTAESATTAPSSDLIRSAQTQLARIGCLSGKADGVLNPETKGALDRYNSIKGRPSPSGAAVSDALVTELTKQTARVCPLACKAGETAKGETCVANAKPAAPATASRRQDDEAPAPRKPAPKQAEREQPKPRAQQEAVAARPSGGGGHHTMIGVGF